MVFKLIDRFAERLDAADLLIGSINNAARIEEFEAILERRLPASFRDLVTRYAFRPFEWGPISFFGNSETYELFSLHIAAMRDRAIWETTRQAGFIYFGRPEQMNYDPICFSPSKGKREPPIVQLDHEEILINSRIKIVAEIAPSFVVLAERLISDGSNPIVVEEWSEDWLLDDKPPADL